MDSTSESDPNISKDSCKIDETEMQLIAESRGIQLEDLNDHLRKENSKLRAQFDEAIRSNLQIEDLYQKIQSMSSENNELKSQNEDLKNHLSLAIQTNDELKQKFEEEKENLQDQRRNDISNFQREIDKTNQKLKEEIENHQIIVNQFENSKEKIILELKASENSISRLLTAAEHFFELHFKNSDDLITYLNKPPLNVQKTRDKFDVSSSITVKNQQIADIEKKKRKIQIKFEEQKRENEDLKNEILDIKKGHCSQIQEYIRQIDELKAQIHEKEENHKMIDIENKRRIDILNANILTLKNEAQKVNNSYLQTTSNNSNAITSVPLAQSTSPSIQNLVNPIITDIKTTEKCNSKIINLEDNIEEMTSKNNELEQRLSEAEDKISILSEKLKGIEKERDETQRNYEKAKTDLNALNLLHENTTTEMQTLRIALRSKDGPQELEAKKAKIKELKKHIESLEKDIQSKEKQINEQIIRYDEKLQSFEKEKLAMNNENDRLKNHITSLEEQIKCLNDDLGKRKIEQQLSFNASNPPYMTSYPCQPVQRIIKREKDNSIDCTKEYRKQLKKSIKLNEQLQKEKESFFLSLSSIFSPKNEFSSKNINQLIDSITIMKKENESFSTIVKHLIEVFSLSPNYPIIDAGSIISQINKLHSKLIKQKENLKRKSSQNNQFQKTFSDMKDKINNLESQISAKQSENQKLLGNLAQIETKLNRMKRIVQSQKLQISNFDKIKEDSEITSSIQVDKIVNERNKIESSLRDQLNDMNNGVSEYQKQIAALNEENSNLKETIRNQKADIVELKLKLSNSAKEIGGKEEILKSSFNFEQLNLNKTIADLQNQLQTSRDDLEKLTKQLLCARKKLAKMKSFCQDASIEKQKLEKQIETLKEQIEHEKLIADANAKTQILKAQSEFTQKLDEQKGAFEKEKRNYFTFVADQFRQFFNPQDSINEKSFKDVIYRVKDELLKLYQSDL